MDWVKRVWKLESLELESFPRWPSRGSDGKSPQAQPENEISCQVFFHLHLLVLHLAGSALALRWWARGRENVVFLSFRLCKWTDRAKKELKGITWQVEVSPFPSLLQFLIVKTPTS